MTINDASGVNPSRQVADDLRGRIANGDLAKVGAQLPTARALADEYGVALTTAVRAVDELRAEGLIETHRGRGSYVKKAPQLFRQGANRYRRHPEGLAPNRDESARGGWVDHVESQSWQADADDDVANRLKLNTDRAVAIVRYMWTVDGVPIQVSTQWEPLALTRGTAIEAPSSGTRGNPDVISRFDSIGIRVDHVDETTQARMPSASESLALRLPSSVPVLDIRRTHYAGDLPVETANIVIRGDKMIITATHVVAESGSE